MHLLLDAFPPRDSKKAARPRDMTLSSPTRHDLMFAALSVPLFAVTCVYVATPVEWMLSPLFQRVFAGGYADMLTPDQVKWLVATLYAAQFGLSCLGAVLPVTALAFLLPRVRASSAAILFACVVASLLLGTRIKYMFSMPYLGSHGGSIFFSLLAGGALFAAVISGSALRVLSMRSTRTRCERRTPDRGRWT